MTTLTKDQVEQLSVADAKRVLKTFETEYMVDKPLSKLSPEISANINDIANTLLYLEDHIKRTEYSQTMSEAIHEHRKKTKL